MEDRTFSYLTGRFRDYYRTADIELPPNIENREWGYIPWKRDGSTVMIRHKSMLEIGNADDFLASETPRHVYTSASEYEDPSAPTMDEKRWKASDLVFDIDIDENHLPDDVNEDDDLSYYDELSLAKDHLNRLLTVLEDDFGFEDLEIVFSGGRGYHVHVRDPDVRELKSNHRTELVSYIQGVNLDLDALTQEGMTTVGTSAGSDSVSFKPDGGWSKRVHKRTIELLEEAREVSETLHEDEAIELLSEIDEVGKKRAGAVLNAYEANEHKIRAGEVSVHPAMKSFAKGVADMVHEETYADIDEPVTTDINRLIRLPGSLHGGTGMRVCRIPRDELASFSPLEDAIAGTFEGQDISVRVTEPTEVRMGGDEFDLDEGEHQVPEAVGMYLMAQGNAEKQPE